MRAAWMAFTLAAMVPASSLAKSPVSTEFQWPATNPSVISDARLSEIIRTARSSERRALGRARSGERLAAQAKRRASIRSALGSDNKSQTIDAGTVLTGSPYNTEYGTMLGVITYPSGATMTGMFGPDEGVYTPSPESTVSEFAGWVFGARSSQPLPMEGVFSMKSGDTFVGTFSGDLAYGAYESADEQQRFVGKFDLAHGSIQPVAGVVESRKGRLLATLLPSM